MRLLVLAFLLTPFAWAVNPVINGQTIFSDAAPTITNCGTSPSAATGGTSNGATITVGTAGVDTRGRTIAVLQCTLTYATAFTNPPVLGISTFTNGLQVFVVSSSTTVLIVYFNSNAAGQKFSFVAF